MFRIPKDWTSHSRDSATTLEHPSGATITSWTNHEPITRVRELAAQRWSQLDQYAHERDESVRILLTESGANACLISSSGQRQGAAANAMLGFVVLSNTIAVVGGVAPASETTRLRSAMTEIVTSFDSTDSATWRFLYAPPSGWHGQAQGNATVWYAPSFPRIRASLTVSPAERRPPHGAPHHVFDAIVAADRGRGFMPERGDGPESIASGFGLAGSAWSILGIPNGMARLCRDIVVLADELHVYTFILATLAHADREACMPALREVVRSARPASGFDELVLA